MCGAFNMSEIRFSIYPPVIQHSCGKGVMIANDLPIQIEHACFPVRYVRLLEGNGISRNYITRCDEIGQAYGNVVNAEI